MATLASVSAPAPIAPPQSSPNPPDKTPDANAAAADGTRLPQPTVLAPLPPGQGTRIDQLA